MKDFLEKWHNDKKFKVKIKLLLYTIFIVIVTIYAASLNASSSSSNILNGIKNEVNQDEKEKVNKWLLTNKK